MVWVVAEEMFRDFLEGAEEVGAEVTGLGKNYIARWTDPNCPSSRYFIIWKSYIFSYF